MRSVRPFDCASDWLSNSKSIVTGSRVNGVDVCHHVLASMFYPGSTHTSTVVSDHLSNCVQRAPIPFGWYKFLSFASMCMVPFKKPASV